MKIAILGFGREGKSVLKFLKTSSKYKGAKIDVLDQKDSPDYLKNLSSYDLAFRSPGVPYNLPEIQRAIKNGVEFTSATKLFFDLCPAEIIGVTGTKGKGTTSTLICEILKNSGKKVLLAGNIGKSPLEILSKTKNGMLVVLELSSFQLQDLKKSPSVAVITEIFPDHMDVHKNMKEYLGAKANICRYQKKSDAVFYFSGNQPAQEIAKLSPGKKISVTAPNNLFKNRLLASEAARYLGCPKEIVQKTVKNFPGLEHRLELVKKIGKVEFYNDSASTNPQTTAAAVLSFKKPIILIAGGKDKNLDYTPLAQAIEKSGFVKKIILIGENKNKIKKALSHLKTPIVFAETLKSAVRLTRQSADKEGVILFSPGAASFDMFKDYADRGRQFKKLVSRIR